MAEGPAKEGRIQIKEEFEGRHGESYYAVKNQFRVPKNTVDSFQVALELLDTLFMNKDIRQNEKKWGRIRRQLKEHTVAVSVLGRHGVGKSTLLDALLTERVLPTHRKNNTAVMVTIQHHTDLEGGPRLLEGESNVVAIGKEAIQQYINAENDAVRAHQKKSHDLYLQLKCPILDNPDGAAKAVLVDTPGFEEAGCSHVEMVAEQSLEGSNACLLVMSYTMLRDKGDLAIMQQLHSADPELSNGRRIVVAVTQHDHFYTGNREEEMNAMATRDHVYEGLLDLGFDVPKEQIVVVSGEWALMARELKNDPADKPLFQRARKFLTFYKEIQAKGEEDYDAFEEVAGMDPAAVARDLEEASNIKDLENRVVELSGRCNDILMKSARNKLGYYMQQATDELRRHLQKCCDEYQKERDEEDCIRACLQDVSLKRTAIELTAVRGEESEIYSTLKELVKAETEAACNRTNEAIRQKLSQLESECLEKVKQELYTTEMYHQDLDAIEDELSRTIKDSLQRAMYSRTYRMARNYQHYMLPDSFYKLENVVRQLHGSSGIDRMQTTPDPMPEEQEQEEEEEHPVAGDGAATVVEGEVHEEGDTGADKEGAVSDGEPEKAEEGSQTNAESEDAPQTSEGDNVVANGIQVHAQSDATGESGAGQEAAGGSGAGKEGDVDVAEMVGQKEDQLHLKQVVEAHHITMPALRRWTSWKKFKLYMRITFGRRKRTDPFSIAEARRSKYRQIRMQESEVNKGFHDIMEAFQEECTALFYHEDTGIKERVFEHFFKEYQVDTQQRLESFQGKYGPLISNQSTVLEEVNERMGEHAEKVQDLEYLIGHLEDIYNWFKPS